jgi:hypothetical protein
MQLSKVSCLQCPRHDSCSSKTRMFVNYCGSRIKNVESSIKEAVLECRSKRGYMLCSVIDSTIENKQGLMLLPVKS